MSKLQLVPIVTVEAAPSTSRLVSDRLTRCCSLQVAASWHTSESGAAGLFAAPASSSGGTRGSPTGWPRTSTRPSRSTELNPRGPQRVGAASCLAPAHGHRTAGRRSP
jgi:hypothetical protein